MVPKRAAARRTRSMPVDQYEFYVIADMTAGFAAVEPRRGFSDGTVRQFLKVCPPYRSALVVLFCFSRCRCFSDLTSPLSVVFALQLRCLICGESTEKDVCLYSLCAKKTTVVGLGTTTNVKGKLRKCPCEYLSLDDLRACMREYSGRNG